MLVLQRLQRAIEELYDVQVDAEVADYLVDQKTHALIPGSQAHIPEQLFCRSHADGEVEIALYISPVVLAHLHQDDPFERLHAGNLEDFCIAAEGVSHFVYLAWRASCEQSLSALDLELQAEIDKFCLCVGLWHAQKAANPVVHRALYDQLFKRYSLHDGLSAQEQQRYHVASRAAAQEIAVWLKQGDDASVQRLLRRARSYCRRPRSQKLRAAG